MFAKKVIFVNWGNIPSLEFNFGPVNLFSGGNGSGKTTILNAFTWVLYEEFTGAFNNPKSLINKRAIDSDPQGSA